MKILLISESVPFPSRNGRELPLENLSAHIAKKHTVDLLVIANSDEDFSKRKCFIPDSINETFFLHKLNPSKRKSLMRELFSSQPAFANHIFNIDEIRKILGPTSYDLLWVSPIGLVSFVEFCKKNDLFKDSKILLGVNDVKTYLYRDAINELFYYRIFNTDLLIKWLRSFLIRKFESRLYKKVDIIHVQTKNEVRKAHLLLNNKNNSVDIVSAPNGAKMDLLGNKCLEKESNVILYMTHLSGGRKSESEWFLKKVWPRIRQNSDVELWLVGSPPTEPIDYLIKDDRIVIKGFVEDLASVFDKVQLSVVPIFHGTGLINRIVDSMAAGVPVVTTEQAAKTIDIAENGINLFTSNSPRRFAELVLELIHAPELRHDVSLAARRAVSEYYSWEQTSSIILKAIDNVSN
jgi:glycosyltransferase involved in cell wall biosynthesis